MRTTPTDSIEDLSRPRGNIHERHIMRTRLTTETIESAALSLESIDNIKRSDSLAFGMLSICDCIADDTFEEGLQNTSCLFVDHWRTR